MGNFIQEDGTGSFKVNEPNLPSCSESRCGAGSCGDGRGRRRDAVVGRRRAAEASGLEGSPRVHRASTSTATGRSTEPTPTSRLLRPTDDGRHQAPPLHEPGGDQRLRTTRGGHRVRRRRGHQGCHPRRHHPRSPAPRSHPLRAGRRRLQLEGQDRHRVSRRARARPHPSGTVNRAPGPRLEAGRHLPLLAGGGRPPAAFRRRALRPRSFPAVHPLPLGHAGGERRRHRQRLRRLLQERGLPDPAQGGPRGSERRDAPRLQRRPVAGRRGRPAHHRASTSRSRPSRATTSGTTPATSSGPSCRPTSSPSCTSWRARPTTSSWTAPPWSATSGWTGRPTRSLLGHAPSTTRSSPGSSTPSRS